MKVILNNPRQMILSISSKLMNFHKITDKTFFEFKISKGVLTITQLLEQPEKEKPGTLYGTGTINKSRLRLTIPPTIISKAKLNIGNDFEEQEENGMLKLVYNINKQSIRNIA